ncbi:MAG TPA: MoxR family ATPase [Acidimicrobiales bacterium]|nr:MoxR family ATPase [Acidimicrobiales bacterium]
MTADVGTPDGIFSAIVRNVRKVIQGNESAIRHAVTCLIAGGHLLIEDVPGVGKTSLGKAVAASVDCRHRRIQFTSDLLPSDVTGVSVYDRNASVFEFRPGPIFANIVLADEINRTPPKTQSALLEAMEERQVTVEGTTYELPEPFMVIATQNPIEHEGTYPLPVSQLDRFLMRIHLGYPDPTAEVDLLVRHGVDDPLFDLQSVASPEQVLELAERVREVHVSEAIQRYIIDLANATRTHPAVLLGMSPRAALALQRAARAWAVLHGRDYVIPDDVKVLALPVIGHRLELRTARTAGGDHVISVVNELLSKVPVLEGERAAR